MHAIMWPRWIEVAVNHEMAAREIYAELVEGSTDRLREEFNQSLVAVAASACTIEALYADAVYLISEQPKIRTTHGRIGQVIDAAFRLNAGQSSTTGDQLRWLFERPNDAVHPYTELEPPRAHPAGLNSSAETAKFNAVESRYRHGHARTRGNTAEPARALGDPVGRRARALSLDCDRAAPRAPGHRPTDAGSDNRHRLTAPRPIGSDMATTICLA